MNPAGPQRRSQDIPRPPSQGPTERLENNNRKNPPAKDLYHNEKVTDQMIVKAAQKCINNKIRMRFLNQLIIMVRSGLEALEFKFETSTGLNYSYSMNLAQNQVCPAMCTDISIPTLLSTLRDHHGHHKTCIIHHFCRYQVPTAKAGFFTNQNRHFPSGHRLAGTRHLTRGVNAGHLECQNR